MTDLKIFNFSSKNNNIPHWISEIFDWQVNQSTATSSLFLMDSAKWNEFFEGSVTRFEWWENTERHGKNIVGDEDTLCASLNTVVFIIRAANTLLPKNILFQFPDHLKVIYHLL